MTIKKHDHQNLNKIIVIKLNVSAERNLFELNYRYEF